MWGRDRHERHMTFRTRRPSRALRVAYLCAAVLQLSLPSAATLADARLDAETLKLHAHFEHVRHGCAPVHPADCALCQFIGLQFRRGVQVSLPLDCTRQVFWVPADIGLGPLFLPRGLPHQRAPPPLV
jgi:hypothetical protein